MGTLRLPSKFVNNGGGELGEGSVEELDSGSSEDYGLVEYTVL